MNRLTVYTLAAALLLAGFAARIALYDYHGLEGDDGFSVALSRTPVEILIPGVIRLELDIHPPLHVLTLKGWIGIWGDSLLSLRLMNITADLLTGALILRLAGRVGGGRAGLAALALWVFAPLLHQAIWLVRMYSLLALFTAVGAVCTVEIVRGGGWRWSVGLLLAAAAALYTHITGVVAVGAFGLVLLIHRRWQGLAALIAAGVLSLPFALSALSVYRSGRTLGTAYNTSSFANLLDVPGTITLTALLHRLGSLGVGVWGWLALALLIGGSLLLLLRHKWRALPLVVMVWTTLPGMMMLAWFFDIYRPRYLALTTPLLLALTGGIIAGVGRRWLGGGALVAVIALSLHGLRADLDRTTRDDFAAAAAFVADHQRPGEAVVVIPDWGADAFGFHYAASGGSLPVTGVFPRVSPDVEAASILESITDGYRRVWLVRYQPEVSDPDNIARDWFSAHAATVVEVFPPGMRLLYMDFAPIHAALPPYARPLDATFGGIARLHGVDLPVASGSARDTRLHPPSAWVLVTLYWESLQPGVAFVPRVRLTDVGAGVWGAALDIENGILARQPVSTWRAGETVAVTTVLNLNPAAPAGSYNIEVMALDPATGEPLPSVGADAGDWWVIAGGYRVGD